MSKIISISTDRNIFKQGSAVQTRHIEYGALFDELHIVVFTTQKSHLPAKLQIAPNVWVYGTLSFSKFFHIRQAVQTASKIITERKLSPENSIVTVQDPFETGLVGLKLKKKFGLPLHVQIHTDFLSPYFAKQSLLNRIRVRFAKKVLPNADAVRAVSKRIVEGLSSKNQVAVFLKPGVVPTILPIFVDLQKIEDAPITLNLKTKYPQFTFIILMASRLTKEKNIPLALRTFQTVVTAYPKTGLLIVGSGPEKSRLETLAKKLGIDKNVVFEDWQNDLNSYYKTANMFLLTSNYEGYALSIVEATAAHCPALSTDVGVANELLKDGESFVCPVGDVVCMTKNVIKLIEHTGLRERFVHEAYDRIEKFTVSNKQTYLERYRDSVYSASHKN